MWIFFRNLLSYGCSINKRFEKQIHDKREDFDFDIINFPFLDGDVPRHTSYGVTYLNSLDSPEPLQILVTSTTVIKPLLPNVLGRATVILNFVERFRNLIADTVPW